MYERERVHEVSRDGRGREVPPLHTFSTSSTAVLLPWLGRAAVLVGSRGNLSLQIFITATTAVTRPLLLLHQATGVRNISEARRERERDLFFLGPTATLRYYNRYGEDSGSGLVSRSLQSSLLLPRFVDL